MSFELASRAPRVTLRDMDPFVAVHKRGERHLYFPRRGHGTLYLFAAFFPAVILTLKYFRRPLPVSLNYVDATEEWDEKVAMRNIMRKHKVGEQIPMVSPEFYEIAHQELEKVAYSDD